MNEIALHILDIVQNSIAAGATLVTILVEEDAQSDTLVIVVEDNGRGIDPAMLPTVTNPFTTSRTTRKVGLGLPLFKAGAEACGGSFLVESRVGVGTKVTARYQLSHIDRPPLGDMVQTMLSLVSVNPQTDFAYTRRVNGGEMAFDTRQIREVLGEDADLSQPMVYQWMKQALEEENEALHGGA